jgi:hypothetical protein
MRISRGILPGALPAVKQGYRPGGARHPPRQRQRQKRVSGGRRNGSGGGGRRKPFLGGLAAASMPRTPPPPDPPRLRQISAVCRSTPCVDALRSTVGILDFDGDPSTHGVDLPCRPRSTSTNSHRNLSEVGRCRSAGCQPHGCGCQAYRDVLAASPHSDIAPPSHGKPAVAVASAVALA